MKKINLTLLLLLMAIFSIGVTSCSNEEEEDLQKQHEEACYYRYWKEYPNSYIKMCDWRMTFRFTKCERVDGGLYIQYVMNNTGFNQKMTLSFSLPLAAGHDDLGNTYQSNTQSIVGTIDGKTVGYGGGNTNVVFSPNQAIKGSFLLKNFDINATAVSVSMKVVVLQPQSEKLMYNNIEFVNLPIDSDPNDLEHM